MFINMYETRIYYVRAFNKRQGGLLLLFTDQVFETRSKVNKIPNGLKQALIPSNR